jgi:site-specific DNA recombinase
MKKVLELIRVSTEAQAAGDRASIPAQRAVNRRTCVQYGLEIAKSIEISDVSGASVLLAPEIQLLLTLMESPNIDGVVTREFSRLMRPENFADYALLQAFVDSKTVLYLPEGPIDLTSKIGRLMGTIRAAFAGLERIEILERVWAAKEQKRQRGELAQSAIVLPWGVGYDKGRGFYYKPEAERVAEAFRRFLAGDQNYAKLAEPLGVTPRGMHLILRNPIWTGWRVIDKKRDTTAAGRYPARNGRQSDRRKVLRAPEEVIRVKVIDQPLVSEADFHTVQRVMDLKQSKHWRSQSDYEHRFVYNGFLVCSRCKEVVHTALARRDYYVCRGRRTAHTCGTKYMAKERLEATLDQLFAAQLTSPAFLERCIAELQQRSENHDAALRLQRLKVDLENLRARRERTVDSYVEGAISRQDRDYRLISIDRDIRAYEHKLREEQPASTPDRATLVEAFSVLAQWEFWSREQKRTVLATLVPEIRVADYQLESLGLNPGIFSNQNTRSGMDSWLPPA